MAASKAGVTPDEVDRVERTNPLADHILDALSTIGLGVAAETPSGISYDPSPLSHKSAPQRKQVREALSELGAARDVVIGTQAACQHAAGRHGRAAAGVHHPLACRRGAEDCGRRAGHQRQEVR